MLHDLPASKHKFGIKNNNFNKHSTVHHLIELYCTIVNSIENKEFNCFVFCDLSNAFDKVYGIMHLYIK